MVLNPFCRSLLALLVLVLPPLTSRADADERWDTGEYRVTYQDDRGSTAIWTYGDDENPDMGILFIDGLGRVYQNRGSYRGYWSQETSSIACDTYREGLDGEPSYHWGRFEITFLDPDFPSRWEAKLGRCDQEPFIPLLGVPILGTP